MILDFIPMNDSIQLQSSGGLDDWGLPVSGATSDPIKARITDNTKRETITVANGEEVVYTADILLDCVPTVTYTDTIVWVDELGNKHEMQPLSIQIKRDFSGAPVAVKVVV